MVMTAFDQGPDTPAGARNHTHPFLPYSPERLDQAEAIRRGEQFQKHLQARRSVRFFSPDPVPAEMQEERVNYEGGRLPEAWREALGPLTSALEFLGDQSGD